MPLQVEVEIPLARARSPSRNDVSPCSISIATMPTIPPPSSTSGLRRPSPRSHFRPRPPSHGDNARDPTSGLDLRPTATKPTITLQASTSVPRRPSPRSYLPPRSPAYGDHARDPTSGLDHRPMATMPAILSPAAITGPWRSCPRPGSAVLIEG